MIPKRKIKISKNKSFIENLEDFFIGNEFVSEKNPNYKIVYDKVIDDTGNLDIIYYLTGTDSIVTMMSNEIIIDENGIEQVNDDIKTSLFYSETGIFTNFAGDPAFCKVEFGWSNKNISDLSKIWARDMLKDFKVYKPKIFKARFSQDIIDVLIEKGYFSEENYTADELLEIAEMLDDDRIFPEDIRDIFLF